MSMWQLRSLTASFPCFTRDSQLDSVRSRSSTRDSCCGIFLPERRESINTVQDCIRGQTQVPQQILVLTGDVKRNGLRAFVVTTAHATLDADALLPVRNGHKPAMRGQKSFQWTRKLDRGIFSRLTCTIPSCCGQERCSSAQCSSTGWSRCP